MSQDSNEIRLLRNCEAVQIPSGQKSMLPEGFEVYIVQELGGSFTVRAISGLFRIEGKHADALGREIADSDANKPLEDATKEGAFDEKYVWEALRACFDPEIPVNIVDLGLIYDMKSEEVVDGMYRVQVKMTLTAPGCGMGQVIANDAQDNILKAPGVADAIVEIVWDPPWHQSMITPEGRKVLGL